MTEQAQLRRPHSFAGRVLLAGSITIGLIAVTLLLWHTADVLLLAFAGVLFAIFLRTLMNLITAHSRIKPGWALAIVMVVLLGLIVAGSWLAAPSVASQFEQFTQKLPDAMSAATKYVQRYPLAQRWLAAHRDPGQMISASVLARVGGVFATTFGLIGGLLVIFFVGVYGAAEPELYRDGVLKLVPRVHRKRGREVLDALAVSLRSWLNTRLFAMAVIGILTTVGLLILHVPLALFLGVVAAILTFVPYIGPTVSAVPAILMGLMESPTKALWVIILALIIHLIEAYFLTPIIQKRAMSLSPVLAILTQVMLGAVWGLLGLALATPITAIVVVLIQTLYVEDVLDEEADLGPAHD